MPDTLIAIEKNCTTGEVIERPLTADEISEREADAIKLAARREQEIAAKVALEALKASAKAKLIAGEPLTPEEAETIVL